MRTLLSMFVSPFGLVSVQTSSLSPKSAGTRMRNRNRLRRGRKYVGCPWSGPPGSMLLCGPIGMWSSSSQLRFIVPKTRLNEPSSFCSQPS